MSTCPINLTKSAEDLVKEILFDHPELGGEISNSKGKGKGKTKKEKERGKGKI